MYVPVHSATEIYGVLFAERRGPRMERVAASLANLAAAFLEQRRLEERATQVEALKEADRLKTSFVSSISHELKTPLAAIKATVTGLLEEGPTLEADRVRTELQYVLVDIVRLDESIGDLLDLSRLEGGAWRLSREPYGIGEVIGTVIAALPPKKRQRVELAFAEDLTPVAVDFRQMARALGNMISNALAYSPADAPVILGARREGNCLLVSVEDRGPGVRPDERESIFGKFYRGSAAVGTPGTGLGLAVTCEIITAHGGRVWVEDVAPTGARFVVSLPLADREGEGVGSDCRPA